MIGRSTSRSQSVSGSTRPKAIRIRPTCPYSFALSLKRLQDLPHQVVPQVEPGPVYVRALDQAGRLGLVRIGQDRDDLVVELEGDIQSETILHRIRRAFYLDLNLAHFHRHMEAVDPVMAALVRRYDGARPIAAFTAWESLAVAIISQQVNISFAYRLIESLVRLCGRSFHGYFSFPGPERVADLQHEDLRALKFSARKAEYLIDTARALVGGQFSLNEAVALPADQAIAVLTQVRGVGRWTAECVLMEAGHLDIFPAGDLGVRSAIQRFYGLETRPSEAEVRHLGELWSPYRALACFYLWLGLLDMREPT